MGLMQPGRDVRAILREQEQRIRGLEHEEAVALDGSGRELLRKQAEGRSIAFTDTQVEQMRGAAIFTHNHPGGRSFSPDDVAFACALELGELRVVTPEWTHVLRPGPTGWTAEYWHDRLDDAFERGQLAVNHELRQAIERGRLSVEEANADFLHRVWEWVADREGLEYDRFTGERTDAD
jgi:hypothetical protein